MRTTKNKSTDKKKKTFAVVDKKVGNYEKHTFFVKKANQARALLKTADLPGKLSKAK